MLPMNVLIAFFLAVCIRNSVSAAEFKYVIDDKNVSDTLRDFLNGIVPILVITDKNPLDIGRGNQNALIKFINSNYSNLIVVDNKNNNCALTVDIMNSRMSRGRVKTALYMIKDGQVVTKDNCRVTSFTTINLNEIKVSADKYVPDGFSPTLLDELLDRIYPERLNQVVNNPGPHPGILAPQRQVGYPVANPVGNQPIGQVNARRQNVPVERNLLGTMENPRGHKNNSGGSTQTYSQHVAWDYLDEGQDQSRKRRRFGEGPSGP